MNNKLEDLKTTSDSDSTKPKRDTIPAKDDFFKSVQEWARKEIKEQVENNKIKIVETLGIFVALFTFISINVQIFSRISNLFAASVFSFLFFCIISEMIILLDFFLNCTKLKGWHIIKDHRIVLMICFLLLMFIPFYFLGDKLLNSVSGSTKFGEQCEEWIDEKLEDKLIKTGETINNLQSEINNLKVILEVQ